MEIRDLAAVGGALSVLSWTYVLLGRGGFWQVRTLFAPGGEAGGSQAGVAVVVPARDEAAVIVRSVESLLQQAYGGPLHIFVVDDGSSDDTARVARQAAGRTGKAEALTLLEGRPLPPGWSGKVWALEQGVQRARELRPQYLLFTDADVVHAPDSVATLVGKAEREAYDLASVMVRLRCETPAEKLLIPAFVFFFFKLYPPAWIADPRRDTAGAAGGCLLIRPEALQRAGGLAAVRGEIIDDCALARVVKKTGGRVWLGLAARTLSIREYGSAASIGRMISRTAFNQLRHSTLLLVGALAGMVVAYLLPPALVVSGRPLPAALGILAWAMMTTAYLPMARFYGLGWWWAVALPLVALFYMGATVYSALRYWAGRGGEWKGRVQDMRQGATD
ncbi:MAG TPA: glycosyltransferase [Terriglobales bacterium]|nr:glycosyltransferase [Terriglobales bacterium]